MGAKAEVDAADSLDSGEVWRPRWCQAALHAPTQAPENSPPQWHHPTTASLFLQPCSADSDGNLPYAQWVSAFFFPDLESDALPLCESYSQVLFLFVCASQLSTSLVFSVASKSWLVFNFPKILLEPDVIRTCRLLNRTQADKLIFSAGMCTATWVCHRKLLMTLLDFPWEKKR